MSDLTNQQVLDTIHQEFAAIRAEMVTKQDISRLERKLDDHKTASTQHHLKILEEIGHLYRQLTKVSATYEDLGQRFGKLRIITE